MKLFATFLFTAMVAIPMEKCIGRFVLVEIEDEKVPTPRECCEHANVPEFCLGLCSPADAMTRQGKRITACSKYDSIIEGCFQGAEPRIQAPSKVLPILSCLSSSQYRCSPDLRYTEDGAGGWVVQCPNTEDPNEMGNFISYKVTAAEMSLDNVCMTNCGEPRPKACHCNAMLDKLLARNTNVNEITGLFVSRNFMEGCRCYLGAAARANFKFVRMDEPGFLKRCEEKKEISANKLSSNYYVKVCDTLLRQGCEDKGGRITKV